MKHTTTMTAAVLALMLNLTGCDGPSPEAGSRPSGGAVERIKALLGMESAEPGVVATVDGIPIYLRQVEGLYDMTSLAPVEGRTVTLEEVRADYAECLRTLVEQVLIRRELAVRDRSVSDDDVLRLEETVSSGYDERPGPEFDPWIEDAGLAPDLWREQLRARLELERWQAELARSIAVGEEEVEAYVAAHPDEMVVPAQVEYLLVSGKDKARVEAARKSGASDPAALRAEGLDVRRFRRSVESVPDIWGEELARAVPGGATPLRETGGSWRYAVLLDRQSDRPRTPAEMYAYAEERLMEQRLPEAFDAWLADALSRTKVRMAEPLLPHNARRPAPPPPSRAPLRLSGGAAGSDAPEALQHDAGAVEAEQEA